MILIFFPFLFVAYTAKLLLSGWDCCGIWITMEWIWMDGWMQCGLIGDRIWRKCWLATTASSPYLQRPNGWIAVDFPYQDPFYFLRDLLDINILELWNLKKSEILG